jgi:hypothetical protein
MEKTSDGSPVYVQILVQNFGFHKNLKGEDK